MYQLINFLTIIVLLEWVLMNLLHSLLPSSMLFSPCPSLWISLIGSSSRLRSLWIIQAHAYCMLPIWPCQAYKHHACSLKNGHITHSKEYIFSHEKWRPWGYHLPTSCNRCSSPQSWKDPVKSISMYIFSCRNANCHEVCTFDKPQILYRFPQKLVEVDGWLGIMSSNNYTALHMHCRCLYIQLV